MRRALGSGYSRTNPRFGQRDFSTLATTGLDGFLLKEVLRSYATPQSYSRGVEYAAASRVRSVEQDGSRIVAEVAGTAEYHVELWAEDGELSYYCECPVGADGECCKHIVAVGLVWIERRGTGGGKQPGKAKPGVTLGDVRAYLGTQSREALVEMLMEQVRGDADLRQKLILRVARSSEGGPDIEAYRKAIDRVAPGDYVEYAEAFDWSMKVGRVLDSLQDLLDDGYAGDVMALIEYAVEQFDEAVGQVDDSDGYVGDELARLPRLYLRACEAARPDPEALAQRLFDWIMTLTYPEYYDFLDSLPSYTGVLGDSGRSALRGLASEQWNTLPSLGPDSEEGRYGASRFQITRLMESIAIADGDIDALVAVKSRDLAYPYSYLSIAEVYRNAGRDDEALDWAQRGRAAFPQDTDNRLLDFLIEEYHRRERYEDEMEVAWQRFTDTPTIQGYQFLEQIASRIEEWPKWRERAWQFLRDRQGDSKTNSGNRYRYSAAREIVNILLYEKRDDEAWIEAMNAPEGEIPGQLWLQIADRRAASHPDDAVRVYLSNAHSLLSNSSSGNYEAPVQLLRKCRDILIPLGRSAEFAQYVLELRDEFRRKRNFLKLLAAQGWV